MKAYIDGDGDGMYGLITADGRCWYCHWCSSKSYASGDLYYNRPERIKELKKEYGEVEVLFLGEDEMTRSELRKRNKQWYDAYMAQSKDGEQE